MRTPAELTLQLCERQRRDNP